MRNYKMTIAYDGNKISRLAASKNTITYNTRNFGDNDQPIDWIWRGD